MGDDRSMGLQFRRSVGFGPLRVTATKRGMSASLGVKGARVGVNSKGQVRRTVGLPGTGVYDTEVVGHVGAAPGDTREHANPVEPTSSPGLVIAPGARNTTSDQHKSTGKTVAIVVMAIVIVVLLVALGSK